MAQDLGIKITINGDPKGIEAAAGRATTAIQGIRIETQRVADATERMSSKMAATLGHYSVKAYAVVQGLQGLNGAARELITTASQFDTITKSLQVTSGSSAAAAASMQFVTETSQRLGLSVVSAAKAFADLQAASAGTSLEGQQTQKIFSSVTQAMAALGKGADETQGALLAIGQMMSKGTIASEELRGQLGERLPGAFQVMARALGVSTAELSKMLEQGQVGIDVLPKFAQELNKAYSTATFDSIQGNINRISNAWDNFVKSAGEALNIAGKLNTIANLVTPEAANDTVTRLKSQLQNYNAGSLSDQMLYRLRYSENISTSQTQLDNLIRAQNKASRDSALQEEKSRVTENARKSASAVAETEQWLTELETAETKKRQKLIQDEYEKRQSTLKKQASDVESSASKAAKAYASERDEIAKTIAQLQFELEVNRLSDAEKSIQLALHEKLTKAKGAERTEIESLVRQIDAETKAREAAAEAQRDEAEKAAKYTDEYVRLYEKFNPKTAAIDASLKDAWSANDMGLFKGDAMALRTALEDAYKDSSTAGAEATNKAFERAIENIQDGFGTMFKSLLNGEALNSFKDFANNIKNTLIGVLSQAMSTGLMNIFSGKGGNGDWMSLLAGGAMMVGNLIGNALSSSAPTRAYTAAETNTTAGLGTGALKLADSYSRDIGYAYQSTASIQFNQAAKDFGSSLSQGLSAILTKTAIGSAVTAGLEKAFQPMIDGVKGFVDSLSSGLSNTTSKALSGIGKLAGDVMAGLGAIYSVFEYFSGFDDMLKGSVVGIAGKTIATLGSVAAGVAGVMSLMGIASGLLGPIGIIAAIAGSLMSLFSKTRTPNTWLYTEANKNTRTGQYNPNTPTYQADVGKSGWIGESTPFGSLLLSTHEADMNNRQMKDAFGGLLKTIKTVDTTLYDTLMRLDKAAGQAGQTMSYYYAKLNKGKGFAVNQDLEGADFGAMVKSRYAWISNILAQSGTEAGMAFDAWFDMLNKKLLKASKKNSFQVLGVVDMLSNNLEDFMSLPLSLVNVIGDSVKAIKKGRSVQDVSSEIAGIVASFATAKEGLTALGSTVADEALVTFLANVNKLGYSVQDAGANLLGYATMLKAVNQDIAVAGDALMASIDSKLKSLQEAGLNSAQATGVFLTNNVLAQLAKEAGVAFKEADLDAASMSLKKLADASSQTAKNVIEQAIADNKLGSKSYDAAVAILVKNGKLEEATVAEAEYAVALQNVAKAQVEAIGFVQQLGYVTGNTLGQMGVSFETMTSAAQNVVKVFGDIKTAASTLDTISKTFLSPTEYAQYNLATAQRSLSNMKTSNPALSGITEASVTAMLKSGDAMKSFIDQLAAGNGEMAKSTIEYINLLIQAKTAQQQLNEALKNLISLNSLRTGYRSARASELQTQLAQIQGQYLDSMTSMATNGASLKDQLGAIDIALASLGDAAAKASLQIQQAFAQIYANIADKRYNLALRMAEAQGVDTSALQQQRAMELLASSSIDSQLQGIDALQAAIESRYSKELTAIKQAGDAYKQISKYVDSLKLNAQLSPLSNEARLAEARSQYQTQLAMAKAGDTEALSSITQFADSYLQEAQAFFASSTQYADIFDSVSGALKELVKPVSVDEQIQQNTSDMVKELEGINTLLDKILSAQQGIEKQQLDQVASDLQGASSIFNSQKAVLTSLQAALEAGTISETDAQSIADQRLSFFKSLESLFAAGLMTDADREKISEVATGLTEGVLSALSAGTLDKPQFDLIDGAANGLLDSVISALSSGSWSNDDQSRLAAGVSTFADNLVNTVSGLSVKDDDTAKLVNALSGLTKGVATLISSITVSDDDSSRLKTSVSTFVGNLGAVVGAVTLGDANQTALNTSVSTLTDNLGASVGAVTLGDANQTALNTSVSTLTDNLGAAVSAITLGDANQTALNASVSSLVGNIGNALSSLVISTDDKANMIDALSGVTSLVTTTLGALDISTEQKDDMTTAIGKGLDQMSGSIKTVLEESDFSPLQLALIAGGYGQAAENTKASLDALDFSDSQLATLQNGLGDFASAIESAITAPGLAADMPVTLKNGIDALGAALSSIISTVDTQSLSNALSSAMAALSKQAPSTTPDNTASLGPVGIYPEPTGLTTLDAVPSDAAWLDSFNKRMYLSNPHQFPSFAKGGISNQASIFGEAGPEAAVPLPDGRRIPVVIDWQRVPSNTSSDNSKPIVDAINAGIDANARGQSALKAELAAARDEINTLNRRLARLEVA